MTVDLVVLTDFSTAADHALHYATDLSRSLGARIHLLHFWQHSLLDANFFVEVPTTSSYFGNPVLTRKEHEEALRQRCESFSGEVAIEGHFMLGSMTDKLPQFLRQVERPLLVIGKDDTEYLPDELVDSTSLGLLHAGHLPLLIIPEKTKAPSLPTHVVFASDGQDFSVEGSPFLTLLERLQPYLSMVEVAPSADQPRVERLKQLAEAKFGLAVKPTAHVIERDDVAKGVRRYCSEHKADLLAMVHHRHSLVERLFHETVTSQFVLHPKIPLLILPG